MRARWRRAAGAAGSSATTCKPPLIRRIISSLPMRLATSGRIATSYRTCPSRLERRLEPRPSMSWLIVGITRAKRSWRARKLASRSRCPSRTSNAKAEGRFGKQDFRYVTEEDVYVCPAGKKLAYHYTTEENGLILRRYWTHACHSCAIKHS